jgi:very-short-patch-repair endonuclease
MLDASESLRLANLYDRLRLKLLDLSLKNRMLSYSFGARSRRHLQIVDEVLDEVYGKLVEKDSSLRTLPLDEPDEIPPEEKSEDFLAALQHARTSDIEYLTKLEALESQGRDDEIALARLDRELRDTVRVQVGLSPRPKKNEINRAEHARTLGIDPSYELPDKASKKTHSDQALQTLKFPDELESVMEKISDTARLAEEEMGLSTLFLAFGFLEWYESEASEKKLFAPLLLLPVRVQAAKSRGRKTYFLSAREGAAETNLSLQKRLEQFPCILPGFESGEEEVAASISKYLEQVKAAIEGRPRWNVRRWLVLGHFAFGRSAMYADLDPENWKTHPAEHELISALLRGTEESAGADAALPSIPEDYPIDEPAFEKIAPWLIQDADASQHSALVDVMRDKNLVIQGPPGTGKSQTITNIIANAMAAGKRILFLSEKQAALEVVKRRLESAGLGDFCLELHSDKSSPKSVIEDLKRRVEVGFGHGRPMVPPSDLGWHESRKEIATYLRALHAEQPDGATPYGLIWSAVRGRGEHSEVIDAFDAVMLPDGVLDDPDTRAAIDAKLPVFVYASSAFAEAYGGSPAQSPWRMLDLDALADHDIQDLVEAIADLRSAAVEMAEFISSVAEVGVASVEDAATLIDAGHRIDDPGAGAASLVPVIVPLDLDEAERVLALIAEWHQLGTALAQRPPDVARLGMSKLIIASRLMECGLRPEFAGMPPAQFYQAAERTILRDRTAIDFARQFLSILSIFGLDQNLPSGALTPLAMAVQAGAKVQPDHRRWIKIMGSIDADEFWSLRTRWIAVAQHEADWRSYCEAFGDRPWPAPEAFEEHAALLRKSGIKKAWAAARGALGRAREFSAQFGFEAGRDVADLLSRLGKHVGHVHAFETNQAAARLLGEDWRGLGTDFNGMATGLKLRAFFGDKIGGVAYGADIAKRLVDLAPAVFERVVATPNVETASAFRQAPADVLEQFDARPLSVLVELSRTELDKLHKALAVDETRSLAELGLPIRELAAFAELAVKRETIRGQIAGSPVGEEASQVGATAAGTAQALSLVEWIRMVAGTTMPNGLRTGLLSVRVAEEWSRLRNAAERGSPLHSRYVSVLSRLRTEFAIGGLDASTPANIADMTERLLRARQELSAYLAIRRCRAELAEVGLGPFIDRAEKLGLSAEQIPGLLSAIVAHRRAERLIRADGLARASGFELDARRRQFAERDRKKTKNDSAYVRSVLLQKRPVPGSNVGSKKTWTEMALLQNEFSKQGRFTPVRSLLVRAGRSIQALKPCFMMSPLSLAKFVSAERLDFDLLVIDEASQMRPEDALGSIRRAKQIVVVGDQKQLPPTDFFARSSDASDDEEFEDVDDESILESCQKTFREVRRLKWHYRSRCESLIRFSNENFYRDSPLITFPVAKPGSFSIDLIPVNGVYQLRRNPAEAGLVAEKAVEIMRRYADADVESIPTLGIVTINIDQRDLLQEELNRLCAGDPLVERYQERIARKSEPVFVKNLENVQGDERDIILISLTYGREPGATEMKQRFGPINGKQGHRRLNVLFTRARLRIGLFASFGSIDVRPTESSQEGVHVLKRYLEYAEGLGRAPIETMGGEPDSDFEIEVAERLRGKGYEVERQVGVSGFRIDIGVRDPDHPMRFLAGVECDGARYHSSKSARDRDRLREQVLRDRGWEILRIWSTDWFEDPARETDKLAKKLQERRERPRDPDEYSDLVEILVSGQGARSTEAPAASKADDEVAAGDVAVEQVEERSPGAAPPTRPAEAETVRMQSLLEAAGPLTREEAQKALFELRETVIRAEMPNWEMHRSILRDAMVETFVSQNIDDPEHWFLKVPMYLRQGTNPIEKNRYIERICDIIARIVVPDRKERRDPPSPFTLSAVEQPVVPRQTTLPLGLRSATSAAGGQAAAAPTARPYLLADLSANGLHPDPSRFYESSYRPTLREMVGRVIEAEAPIYEDILVDRIARAHGFQRSGSNIYQTVSRIIDREYPRSKDGDRYVIWSSGASPDKPYPYRGSRGGARNHMDIPVAELASLALPYLRLRVNDEDVIRRMADHCELGRLRESARERFEEALKIAKSYR